MPTAPQKSAPQNDKVKKPPKYLKMVCVFFVLACVIALFFPQSRTFRISGKAQVLTNEGESIGDCDLSAEIHEISSWVVSYRKLFMVSLDDRPLATEFLDVRVSEAGDFCLITRSYYDRDDNAVCFCSLLYPSDRSFVEIRGKDKRYCYPSSFELPCIDYLVVE